jgi:glutamyl-Q tRNA(Asp) synthetase
VLYPCFCTRRQIRAEIAHAGQAPHGPAGETIYPGICRSLGDAERGRRIAAGEPFATRLDVAKALALTGPLVWRDVRAGSVRAEPELLGDVVLARKDVPTSYHLAVTVDDALQGVTLVTRGEDLFHATHVHRLLQALLGFAAPRYYHHNLIADSTGLRLAKRNRAVTLRTLRQSGRRPDDIWRLIGLPDPVPATAAE